MPDHIFKHALKRVSFRVASYGNHLRRCACKCYVLNVVFAFAFTPSPLKLITHNKQWLNTVLLSSLLKFWDLVLNYKSPNKCVFTVFMALFVIFNYFLRWNLSKFLHHIVSCGIRILKTKKVGFVKAVFSIFSNLCLLPLQRIWSFRFLWKTSSNLSKIFTTNLPNFMEFHRRKRKKIPCQFCFLCSCWRNKTSKNTGVFLWVRADYFLSPRAIVKL